MKILFVIYSLSRGGAQRATVNIANGLTELGHEVHILTLSENKVDKYYLNEKVNRSVLSDGDATSSGMLQGLYNNVLRLWLLRGFIRNGQPDVAIAMGSQTNVLLALATARLKTVAIGAERSHPPMQPASTEWALVRKYAYYLLNDVVCLTSETGAWARGETKARSVSIIPNGVQIPIEESTPLKYVTDFNIKVPMILTVGRLHELKQTAHVIEAFSRIDSTKHEVVLAIVGEGKLLESLKELTINLDVSDRVLFIGDVGNVGHWYEKATLYVLSSRTEGFPNSLLEAMASGACCISYNCPTGPADLIDDGVNGVLVPLNSIDDLSLALQRTLGDGDLRATLSRNAANHREQYSLATISSKWSEYLTGRVQAVNSGSDR